METGFHWCFRDANGRNCSAKPWSQPPAGSPVMATGGPTSAPTSTSAGTAGRAETRTRGVGTMWSVGQQRKGISRPGKHPRLACPGVVQPPRRWISGNTDAVWLALEGGWRSTVLRRADRSYERTRGPDGSQPLSQWGRCGRDGLGIQPRWEGQARPPRRSGGPAGAVPERPGIVPPVFRMPSLSESVTMVARVVLTLVG